MMIPSFQQLQQLYNQYELSVRVFIAIISVSSSLYIMHILSNLLIYATLGAAIMDVSSICLYVDQEKISLLVWAITITTFTLVSLPLPTTLIYVLLLHDAAFSALYCTYRLRDHIPLPSQAIIRTTVLAKVIDSTSHQQDKPPALCQVLQ